MALLQLLEFLLNQFDYNAVVECLNGLQVDTVIVWCTVHNESLLDWLSRV